MSLQICSFLAALQFLMTAMAGVRGKSQPLSCRCNEKGRWQGDQGADVTGWQLTPSALAAWALHTLQGEKAPGVHGAAPTCWANGTLQQQSCEGARGGSETFPTAGPPRWEALGQVPGLWKQLCSPPAGSEHARLCVPCRSWEMPRAERVPVILRVTWPQHEHTASPCCWGQPLPSLASLLSLQSLLWRTQVAFSLFLPLSVPRAAGSPARTSQGPGVAPAECRRLK